MERGLILGAGVTGLAASRASGWRAFEACDVEGGLCASYYVAPGSAKRHADRAADAETYRFEVGGGHWIFGGDPAVRHFLGRQVPLAQHERRAAVFLSDEDLYVPYPLQYHLAALGKDRAGRALVGLEGGGAGSAATMAEWLSRHFGDPLMDLFFAPFHEAYTAGLWTRIAPQDAYKSPVDLEQAAKGARGEASRGAGYNVRFVYPEEGLDVLGRRLARDGRVAFGRRAVRIDPSRKRVWFEDGTEQGYETLVSTLPLNVMTTLTGLDVDAAPDPYTSVLVLNIGAERGPRCPGYHWVYVPRSRAGFFRVGFYSNVDASFLPASVRAGGSRVSLYVERAFPGGQRPAEAEQVQYVQAVINELRAWGYVGAVDVVDPSWVEVAYTWSWPGSTWRSQALEVLTRHDILMVGRYGRWIFQGIADSVRDGFFVGAAVGPGRGGRADG